MEKRERILLGELVKGKTFDYISVRTLAPDKTKLESLEDDTVFMGVCSANNGALEYDPNDPYPEETEVVFWEEWKNEDNGVHNGLTIVIETEWYTPETKPTKKG